MTDARPPLSSEEKYSATKKSATENSATELSVTELAELLNDTLEEYVGSVSFIGEIHQLTRAQSGHIYFDLKDEDSKISAVLWRGTAQSLSFAPAAGMSVICQGRPNLYHRSGKLQMVVTRMQRAGAGVLQEKFLALKAALEKEGLFAASRKRAIPLLPRAVGIITSASGAAIHDMTVRFKERMPSLPLFLMDARVQGKGAAEDIASAIETFNTLRNVDVIIVGRGGGSLEDLWAFNEEVLIRAIFASEIPIVSGVGHEVDVTLSDLVADVRAPTPTAAAEMVVPHRKDLMQHLMQLYRRLSDSDRWLLPLQQAVDENSITLETAMERRLQRCTLLLENAYAKVQRIEPGNRLRLLTQGLREKQHLLDKSVGYIVQEAQTKLQYLKQGLDSNVLLQQFESNREQVERVSLRLHSQIHHSVSDKKHRLRAQGSLLESLSHERVLERGFALLRNHGRVVKGSESVELEDRLDVELARGSLAVTVVEKK